MNPTIEQMDPRILGMRLQEARKSAGMTQSETADHLQMSRTTIVGIEKGERRINAHEIIQFAKFYRRSVSDLLSQRVVTDSFVPQFRATQKEIDPTFERAAGELQTLSENYVELEGLLGTPLIRRFPPEYKTRAGSADRMTKVSPTPEPIPLAFPT